MSPITHAILPVMLAYPWFPKRRHRPVTGVSVFLAISGALPDMLDPHITLDARYNSWSHTVFAWAGFSSFLFLAFVRWRGHLAARTAIFGSLAYGLHIVCDLVSGGGRPLLPFVHKPWGGDYVPSWTWGASDLALLLFVYFVYRWIPLRKAYFERQKVQSGK